MTVTASARKTKFGYKPVIKYPVGPRKTEVVEQSIERSARYTKHGRIEGNKYAIGNVYENRQDAINAAQSVIDQRLEEAIKHRQKNIDLRGKSNKWDDASVILWGGEI